MERVDVLINKLQQQLSQKADIHNMLVTTQMLQAELLQKVQELNTSDTRKVAVMMPRTIALPVAPVQTELMQKEPLQEEALQKQDFINYKPVPHPEEEPEPISEPVVEPEMPMPEPTPAPTPKPEPEPIPHFLEDRSWQRLFVEKEEAPAIPWSLDPMTDIPTLAHQEKIVFELNDVMVDESRPPSINERLREDKAEMSMVLTDSPVKDLKKAISINDRHRFIHELFRDDETMYERSIKTINGFRIYAEAEYWIQRELKVKLGWDTTLELVKVFDQIVKRRFS